MTEGGAHLPMRLLLLPLALCATSCVTSDDFRVLADSVGRLEVTLDDESATVDDVQGQIDATVRDIEDIADAVEERTKAGWDSLSDVGRDLGIPGAAMVLLNLYRNRNRRKRDEPVTVQEAKAAGEAKAPSGFGA